MQPALIQQYLPVRRTPERTDLLFVTPGGEGLLLHPQLDELSEAFGFGVTATGLPLRHGAPGDTQSVGQARLRQADAGAQRQHQLTEGIVSLSIGKSLHRRSPFCVTLRIKAL